MIRVQPEDFDIGAEIAQLKAGRSDIGAIVAFIGTVRDQARRRRGDDARALSRHDGSGAYSASRLRPAPAGRCKPALIVHRTGTLRPSDNIVLVVTASEHREAAFRAAEFLMDYLKTSAPFWKRESGPQGSPLGRGQRERRRRHRPLEEARRGVVFRQ